MAHIKSFQTGQHSALSQRILNEIAAARVCLLNAAKKAEYDEELQAQGQGQRIQGIDSPLIDLGFDVTNIAKHSTVHRPPSPKKKQSWQLTAIAAGIVCLGIVTLIFIAWMSSPKNAGEQAKQARHVAVAPPKPDLQPRPKPERKSEPIVESPEKIAEHLEEAFAKAKTATDFKAVVSGKATWSDGSPLNNKATATGDKDGNSDLRVSRVLADESSGRSVETAPKTVMAGTVGPRPPEPPKPVKSTAIPDKKAQSQAMKEMHEAFPLFGSKSAHNEAVLSFLADKLLQQAYDPANRPATRFVAFDQACQSAVKAGNFALAMDAIDQMGQVFDIEAVDMKLDILQAAIRSRVLPTLRKSLAVEASNLVDDALASNKPNQAQVAARIALSQATASKSTVIARRVRGQMQIVDQAVKNHTEFEAANAVLADRPDDAEANLTVGRYQCFVMNNWEIGLPMLAKGSDETLKKLAAKDQAGAAGPESQVALADAWARIALDASATECEYIRSRAASWYRLAEPVLRGLEKERVNRGLSRLETNKQRPARRLVNAKDGSVLVLIPAGDFLAGEDLFKVRLPGYYLGLTEVTNAQYKRFMDECGYNPPGNNWTGWPDQKERPNPAWDGKSFRPGFADHPVTCVTGDDADAYCRWAGLRLPTELEWEKGARGTDGRNYPWGNDWDPSRCFNKTNRGEKVTCPVLTFPEGRSPWGLYNMSGNAWEWCAERQDDQAYARYRRGDLTPATEGGGLWRGGSSGDDGKDLSCMRRGGNVRGCGYADLGFRVAKGVGL